MHQRRQQLPFNLATGEGVLYDISLDAFSIPGPPGSGAPGTTEPTAEKPLDPASLLGSLRRQDHSVYTQPQKPSPPLPVFPQIEDLDFEPPQPSLEQAFLDSHALLSVPSQTQGSQKRSITGDLTSEAMIDSLEQILEDIGDGGIEGLEVEETELRDWENTLVRVNNDREDVSRELNHILANDVFSYVEEALKRETGGYAQGSDQTGPHVSGTLNSSSIRGHHPGSMFSDDECQWQPMTDMKSGFAEQTLLGDVLGDVGCSTGVKGASQALSHRPAHSLTPTQCRNTHQGHTSPLWPPSSNTHQMISTQSCNAFHPQPEVTQQSWLPSVQNTNNIHSSHQSSPELTNQSVQYTLNHAGSQQTYSGPQLHSPSVWQQQQLLQSFRHHTLTHSSHTPGSVSSTAQSFHPQMQRLTGSCMYEKREGHIPNAATVPTRQNGPLLGPTGSRGPTHAVGMTTNAPFTLSHPGTAARVINQGMMQSSGPSAHMAACADVGNISLVHLSGDNAGLGTARTEYPHENGSLQSSFFCWNGDTQVK